ncbi:hypothetical protein [Konateibacter massiliensis]|uniref:hypothetical protein n=1 Tax=Konateibacter massiliensis TaxID=2002841 RepID=UPI000C15CE7F|nr:hypothetical protein [Konateibacter massiliensis]
MKIQNSIIASANNAANKSNGVEKSGKDEQKAELSGNIQASEINLMQPKDSSIKDLLDRKTELTKKSDQLEIQAKLDAIKEKREEDIAGYREDIEFNQGLINDIIGKQDNLKKLYGVEDDSPEEQELNLRRKVSEAIKSGKSISAEDWEAYQSLGAPSEYQSRMIEFDKMISVFNDRIDDSSKQLLSALKEERDESISQEDALIIEKYQEMIEEEMKNIDKQVNEKVIEAAGNVVDESV